MAFNIVGFIALNLFGEELCTIFTILLTFLGKSCNAHILVRNIAIWSLGLILNLGRSYPTFGTNTPALRDGFTKMSVEL